MSYDFEKLVVEKEDRVLVAAINNPPANTMSQKVLQELSQLLDDCLEDESVQVILITGTGEKLFSGGADISEFADIKAGTIKNIGNETYFKIENYPKVIIAALQGSAYGGGLELALACHLRIMADNAKVGFPEVKLGIIPGWGGTQRLPRLISKTRAMGMILTGEPITAQTALEYGLVNMVVPAGSFLEETKAFAKKLAAGAPIAQSEIIKAITKGLETSLEEGVFKIEAAGIARAAASEDAIEGAMAFFQKRPPAFKGK